MKKEGYEQKHEQNTQNLAQNHVVVSFSMWRRQVLVQARLGGEVNDPHDQLISFTSSSRIPYLMGKVLQQLLHYVLTSSVCNPEMRKKRE